MNVGRVSIGTIPSAGIVDVFSGEVANAADLGGDAAPAAWAQPDPPKRAIGRRWLRVAAAALVAGAHAAQVVVPAAETSPAWSGSQGSRFDADSEVRTRLPAGGRRIRTPGSAREEISVSHWAGVIYSR